MAARIPEPQASSAGTLADAAAPAHNDMKTVEITYRYRAGDVFTHTRPADPGAACERLDEGNRSFAALLDGLNEGSGTVGRVISVDPRDFGTSADEQQTPVQQPYAAVLGCSDARVPVELIFNEGPNDLFVVRVAGNGLGPEVLGSLKYAAEHLSSSMRLVVVLGHSGCGAVTSAVDVFLSPARYLPLATDHALRAILDRLLIQVQASATRLQAAFGSDVTRLPGYREALIESSILLNAALSAYSVQESLGGDAANGLQARYGTYVISTRRIWAPRAGSTDCDGLAQPPKDAAGFAALAEAILRSQRLRELLSHGEPLQHAGAA